MSTGTDRSIFVFGIVSVTNASLPTRCAWIVATADGMRTIGASGGPFFPQATKTRKDPHTIVRKDHEDVFRASRITNDQIFLRVVRALPVPACYSTASACPACSAAMG